MLGRAAAPRADETSGDGYFDRVRGTKAVLGRVQPSARLPSDPTSGDSLWPLTRPSRGVMSLRSFGGELITGELPRLRRRDCGSAVLGGVALVAEHVSGLAAGAVEFGCFHLVVCEVVGPRDAESATAGLCDGDSPRPRSPRYARPVRTTGGMTRQGGEASDADCATVSDRAQRPTRRRLFVAN